MDFSAVIMKHTHTRFWFVDIHLILQFKFSLIKMREASDELLHKNGQIAAVVRDFFFFFFWKQRRDSYSKCIAEGATLVVCCIARPLKLRDT